MKKYLAILLASLLMLASLTGCMLQEAEPTETAPKTETTADTAPAPTTDTQPTEPETTAAPEVAEVRWEKFQNDDDYYTSYIVVTGVTADGETVWEYRTADCAQTELASVEVFAETENTVYVNEQNIPMGDNLDAGHITAIDRQTGETVWRNDDFHGSSVSYCFDENGTLYCCGYYGPDCMAISADGESMWAVLTIDESVWWPCRMEYNEGLIYIYYEGNDYGDGAMQYRCMTPDGEQFIGGF